MIFHAEFVRQYLLKVDCPALKVNLNIQFGPYRLSVTGQVSDVSVYRLQLCVRIMELN